MQHIDFAGRLTARDIVAATMEKLSLTSRDTEEHRRAKDSKE